LKNNFLTVLWQSLVPPIDSLGIALFHKKKKKKVQRADTQAKKAKSPQQKGRIKTEAQNKRD